MANTREVALFRIVYFSFLSRQNHTPLLQEEFHCAIILHVQAVESPDISSFIPDLDAIHAQIEEHWARVYGNISTTASLLWDINVYEQFLQSKLLEDYANEPFEVIGRTLRLAECTAKQDTRRFAEPMGDNTSSDKEYQDHVVFPLEESILDRGHVENKLRAVAARQGRPGSDIQPLIDACDWAKLAAVLMNDRDIIVKLTQRSACPAEISKKILAGMNRVQNKYFASLSSPSTFTLAPAGHQTTPLPRSSFWGIYDLIASSFKADSPRVKESSDERRSLLGEDLSGQDLPLSISAVNLKKLE